MNIDVWNGLSDNHKRIIEVACGDKILAVHRALAGTRGRPLQEFASRLAWGKMEEDQKPKGERNHAKRQGVKLGANAIYGQASMQARWEETKVVKAILDQQDQAFRLGTAHQKLPVAEALA